MKAFGLWALALPLLLMSAALAPADEAGPKPEELFQWGEYDSLIRFLEPLLASLSAGATARGDSLELAKANLWLGVAYWATEKRTLAEQAFLRASRLDPALILDRLYATPEILERFESISRQDREQRREAAAASRAQHTGPPAQTVSARNPLPPAARPWRKRGWALGALAAAGLAAGGTLYYVATRRDEVIIPVDPLPSE